MSENYPVSTRDLLVITLKEIGKTIPTLGLFLGAHESVFATIELNRIKTLVTSLDQQLKQIEAKLGRACVLDQHSGQVLLLGCEQARHDSLAESKAKEYGGVVAHYMMSGADMNEVVEVLDSLRKLSAGDLKLLYTLKAGNKYHPARRVDEMIGFTPNVAPFSDKQKLAAMMTSALPAFKRLEGLGVIYLAHENVGGILHDIGALSSYMSMYAHLTPMGVRLVQALPA